MLSARRARLTLLLVVLVAAVAVPAAVLAAKPKTGVYIDTKLQVYVEVRGAPPHVKHFQGPCMNTPQGSTTPVQQGSIEINKDLAISKKRKFSFTGKVTLHSFDTSKVKVSLKGKFKKGKAAGTLKFTDPEPPCQTAKFSAKYYGKNPQG